MSDDVRQSLIEEIEAIRQQIGWTPNQISGGRERLEAMTVHYLAEVLERHDAILAARGK